MLRTVGGQRFFTVTLVIAVVTALVLHFWRIGSAPGGFHPDECAIAYNAYCIARTGADEYGTRWPVLFRSFDTYTDPVAVYSVAPFVDVFGLQEWTARLPSGLYCLMACVAFSLLLRQWGFGAWFALAGGFALSVVPWVFPPSRNCSFAGYMAGLFGLITGLILTDSALRKRSYWLATGAGAVWAFTFYTHQSVRPVLALLAVGSGVVLWRPLVRRWRVVLVIALSALVFLLPMIVTAMRLPGALTARFQQVGIFTATAQPGELAVGIASRYLDYFGPRFLWISGDHEMRHHTGHGGELYWCFLPLVLIGLWMAVRCCRREPRYRVLLVGLLASPVTAALTIDRMHSSRGVYAVIFWLLLAAVGARALWQYRRIGRQLLVVVCAAGVLQSSMYFADYFGSYQTRCSFSYYKQVSDVLKFCFRKLKSGETLYVSPTAYLPQGSLVNAEFKPFLYVQLLFHGKLDPQTYQRVGIPPESICLYDGHVPRWGLLLTCNYVLMRTKDEELPLAVPNQEPHPSSARLLATFAFDEVFRDEVFEVGQQSR